MLIEIGLPKDPKIAFIKGVILGVTLAVSSRLIINEIRKDAIDRIHREKARVNGVTYIRNRKRKHK